MANIKVIEAWKTTLAKYEESRKLETDPKRKAFWTRNINRAKRTIAIFQRDVIITNFKGMSKQAQEELLKELPSKVKPKQMT
jgi:hypothetical protein